MTCHIKLVSYYPLKGFVVLEKCDSIRNDPNNATECIHEAYLHTNYYIMKCKRSISYIANTFKKIHLSYDLCSEYASMIYNDNFFTFGYIFRKWIKNYVENIDHPVLIKEWKLNLDKLDYLKKDDGVDLPPINKNQSTQ